MRKISAFVKSYEEIIKEFEFNLKLLSDKSQYLEELVSTIQNISSEGYYFAENMSLSEVITLNEKLVKEMNRKFVMELTGAFEAKTVYYLRYILKRKSPMGKKIPNAIRSGSRHLMYQLLIPIFKDHMHAEDSIIYAEFKKLVDYRNWLAHGRGKDFKNHWDKFNFRYSLIIISSVAELIPDYPDYLKN